MFSSFYNLPVHIQLAICVTFAVMFLIVGGWFILSKAAKEHEKDERKKTDAWKEYLKFKASRGELTDKEGNRVSLP